MGDVQGVRRVVSEPEDPLNVDIFESPVAPQYLACNGASFVGAQDRQLAIVCQHWL